MFVKSQKILQAFLSKVLLTTEEVRKTIAGQIFIILFSLIFANGLAGIALVTKSPLSIDMDESRMLRVHSCQTSFHSSIIIGYTLVMQFACFIQAFRGRHLPSVMNDGMSLVYASFATVVMFVVMYIIVPFQKGVDKELYQNLTIVGNSLVIFFMMYGQKAIRILAYPKKNTKIYFQEKRLKDMQRQASDRVPGAVSLL